MITGVPTAYFISRCNKKWKEIAISCFNISFDDKLNIRSFAWINILGTNGVINRMLQALAITNDPIKLCTRNFRYHWFRYLFLR